MKRFSYVLFAVLTLSVGCRAQAPTVSHSDTLGWTVPAATSTWSGCTTGNPCTYLISVAVLSTGTTTCPTPNGTNYTPVNSSAPATGTTYTDITTGTVCHIAQTQQGIARSPASNTVGPDVVLGNPLAPAITSQAAMTEKPAMAPAPSALVLAENKSLPAPVLTASTSPALHSTVR